MWTPEDLPLTGMASYYDSVPGARTLDPRVYLRLEVGRGDVEIMAMVDTAAPWCVLEPALASALENRLEDLPDRAILSSRLGRFSGRLYRGTTTILAERGSDLTVETTFFLSPDWPAGNFVGYQGFLERFRFAIDPAKNSFYFGSL